MTDPNVRSVSLRWTGEGLGFEGGPEPGREILVDGDSTRGPAPMELLLMSVAACMAIDVRVILEKSRVPLEVLEIEAAGVRAVKAPKRYDSVTLVYRLRGPSEEDQAKVERSIELSREKYCSVLHTMDPNLDLDIRLERI